MNSRQHVLAPYSSGRPGLATRSIKLVGLAIYCALTGVAVALLPPQLMFLLALPIGFAVAVILWMLPDSSNPVRVAPVAGLLIAYIIANALWPSYLAVDLSGLPWITPPRMIVFALVAYGLIAYATSSALRAELATIINALPVLKIAFWLFWALTFATLVLSHNIAFSINKWVNNQIFWTFLFLAAAWVASKPGFLDRFLKVIIWTSVIIALDTLYESATEQVPWMNHIPSFMRVDEAYLANVLKAQVRAGTDMYRARGPFAVSLICAEYLAVVYPFLIHAMIIAQGWIRKSILVMVLLAVLSAMWVTGARSAMIGFFMSILLYGSFAAFRYWRRNRSSLAGVTTLSMMPILAVAFLGLSLTWPRLHTMTFGGAQHQPSSDARAAQWAMGIPKIKSNPVGHGAAMSGQTLGYTNLGGELTIDTFYLSVLLDYGVLGFACFMIMFGGQVVYGLRLYLDAPPGEETMAGPATIALLNFTVIKAVLSSEFNMPIAFIILGSLFALAWRNQQQRAAVAVTSQTSDARAYGIGAAA